MCITLQFKQHSLLKRKENKREKERKSRERGHKGGKGGQGREREDTLSHSFEQMSPLPILMERRQILAHFRTLAIKFYKHYLLFLL